MSCSNVLSEDNYNATAVEDRGNPERSVFFSKSVFFNHIFLTVYASYQNLPSLNHVMPFDVTVVLILSCTVQNITTLKKILLSQYCLDFARCQSVCPLR